MRNNPDKTALIDADSLVYSVGFSADGAEEKYAISRMAEKLEEMLFIDLGVEIYEGFLTGEGNYRNELAKTAPYKGQRTGKKPVHYALLRNYLRDAWGFQIVNGIEADDIVSTRATELGDTSIVVSIDKDLLQVPGKHFNWKSGEFKEVTKEEGLKHFYRQILTGDRIDNIIGLPLVGPVKADKHLEDCITPLDYYVAALNAYEGDEKRVTENASLLWLQRSRGELYYPGIEYEYHT